LPPKSETRLSWYCVHQTGRFGAFIPVAVIAAPRSVKQVDVTATEVTATWLVHKDAVDGLDYDLDRLIRVWDQTNLRDRDLAENNRRGANGTGYVPGPYALHSETYVNRFVDWHCRAMSAATAAP